jgi:hypothetical protein
MLMLGGRRRGVVGGRCAMRGGGGMSRVIVEGRARCSKYKAYEI